MKLVIIFSIFALQASALSAYQQPKNNGAKKEVQGLLGLETKRPANTPEPGRTLLDKTLAAAEQIRAARRGIDQIKKSGKNTKGLESAEKSLIELETLYTNVFYLGLRNVYAAFTNSRILTTYTAIAFKEREVFAWLQPIEGESGRGLGFRPQKDSLKHLNNKRQQGHETGVKSVSLLEESRERLEETLAKNPKTMTGRLVHKAAASMLEANTLGLHVAQRLEQRLSKGAKFDTLIQNVGSFGGAQGTEPVTPTSHNAIVDQINDVSAEQAVLAYHIATNIKEANTFGFQIKDKARIEWDKK